MRKVFVLILHFFPSITPTLAIWAPYSHLKRYNNIRWKNFYFLSQPITVVSATVLQSTTDLLRGEITFSCEANVRPTTCCEILVDIFHNLRFITVG